MHLILRRCQHLIRMIRRALFPQEHTPNLIGLFEKLEGPPKNTFDREAAFRAILAVLAVFQKEGIHPEEHALVLRSILLDQTDSLHVERYKRFHIELSREAYRCLQELQKFPEPVKLLVVKLLAAEFVCRTEIILWRSARPTFSKKIRESERHWFRLKINQPPHTLSALRPTFGV